LKKIICLGNRFVYPDSFGIEIYNLLTQQDINDVEIIEGGLGGLNLALHFDTNDAVIVVDQGFGFDKNILNIDDVKNSKNIKRYDHDTALYYLINTLNDKSNIMFYISNDEKWEQFSLKSHYEKILNMVNSL